MTYAFHLLFSGVYIIFRGYALVFLCCILLDVYFCGSWFNNCCKFSLIPSLRTFLKQKTQYLRTRKELVFVVFHRLFCPFPDRITSTTSVLRYHFLIINIFLVLHLNISLNFYFWVARVETLAKDCLLNTWFYNRFMDFVIKIAGFLDGFRMIVLGDSLHMIN